MWAHHQRQAEALRRRWSLIWSSRWGENDASCYSFSNHYKSSDSRESGAHWDKSEKKKQIKKDRETRKTESIQKGDR